MPVTKGRKPKLNGSANAFTKALVDLVSESVEKAVKPIKDSQDSLLDLVGGIEKDVSALKTDVSALKTDVSTLTKNTQSQFVEVNKRLGKLEKRL